MESTPSIQTLLEQVAAGGLSADEAAKQLHAMQARPLGFATLDHHRAERCGSSEVIYAAGQLEGAAEHTFGSVYDLALSKDGRLAVLDHLTPALKVYARDGQLLTMLGTEGPGPGEWSFPSSVDWLDSHHVVVLSQGHRRLHIYDSRQGWTLTGEVTLPLVARDFCVLNGDYFVLGFEAERTVHRFDRDGDRVASFGSPPTLPPELAGEWGGLVTQVNGRLTAGSCARSRRTRSLRCRSTSPTSPPMRPTGRSCGG